MAGKFELYKDNAGEFRFRLVAPNGEIVGASEGYKAKASALNAIASVIKNADNPLQYSFFEGKNGKWYFALKAQNNQVILSSQSYSGRHSMDKEISRIKRSSKNAQVEDFAQY